MGSVDIFTSVHLKDGSIVEGDAGYVGNGNYPVLNVKGRGYPGITIFPGNMAQTALIANACLDAISSLAGRGEDIDEGTAALLELIASRAHALSFDEDAEAQAAEAVQA